jgi:hypothetical protein
MRTKLVLALALGLVTQAAALASDFIPKLEEAPRNQQVITALLKVATAPPTNKAGESSLADTSICSIRGGNGSKKKLGQYLKDPEFEYKSGYQEVSPQLMVEFAYDLADYRQDKGYDWPHQNGKNSSWMPYEKQKEYARMWWTRHYEPYKGMGWMFQSFFLHDAICDATLLWHFWGRERYMSQAYIAWSDCAVLRVAKEE